VIPVGRWQVVVGSQSSEKGVRAIRGVIVWAVDLVRINVVLLRAEQRRAESR
jgi:hypothetical protein